MKQACTWPSGASTARNGVAGCRNILAFVVQRSAPDGVARRDEIEDGRWPEPCAAHPPPGNASRRLYEHGRFAKKGFDSADPAASLPKPVSVVRIIELSMVKALRIRLMSDD
jgi:hypothetical protein